MGFLKRFLSLGSSKSRRNKKKQNASHGKDVDAEGRILRQHELAPPDADTSANRLLRSSSTKFSVMSEIDYSSLPPPPLPVGRFPSTPSLSPSPSMLTVATTPGVKRSGTYVVKVHSRTTHSRTEFPHANPLPSPTKQPRTAEPKTPRQDEYDNDEDDNVEDRPRAPRLKEVNFTPKDTSRIYALRRDPSVVSLLNMYDNNGCLDEHAFANTPPTPAPVSAEIEGRQPRPRTGSTLRQLLGEPKATFTEHTHEGDISWAERFLDERLHDDSALSSPASMALETPKDALFSDDLSPPRVAPADTTLSSIGAESSINYPAISSMEVEVSETMEDIPVKAAPAPKPVIEPKTPQRASEVFGFLNRRNTVIIKERDLPEVPKDLSPQTTGISQGATDNISTHDTSLDALHNAIHSANTSHSASNNSSDAPSHLSHAQIHTATMTKLNSAFAASTLSLNLLTSYDESADKPAPNEGTDSIDNADAYEAQPATHILDDHVPRNSTGASAQAHEPRHHHTGSSLSGSSTMNVPPSKIPRGPRPRPLSISRRDEMLPEERDTHAGGAINTPTVLPSVSQPSTSRAAKREAFTAIPQRRHHRIASRSSDSPSGHEVEHAPTRPTDALKTPGPSHSYSRKRPAKPERRATSSGKENTPSPPRASSHAGHTPGGAFGLGFATPSRAKTFAGHLLGREDLQVPPSPASSSELSPVGQDMMNNLRKQRMRARQVERRKGFWVRE